MEFTLTTAENIYKAVLDGIKKESTAVFTPDQFNRLMNNEVLIEWMRSKSGGADYDQHFVDALRNLYRYSDDVAIEDDGFPLPKDYYRMESVSFKLRMGNKNSADLTDWIPVKRMRTDTLSMMKVNPYRTPTDSRLYYFQQKNHVLSYPKNERVVKARFFYLSFPEPIVYNVGGKSQNGNLLPEQNKEIVDIAVRIIAERVKEERYQTILMEENIRLRKQN